MDTPNKHFHGQVNCGAIQSVYLGGKREENCKYVKLLILNSDLEQRNRR